MLGRDCLVNLGSTGHYPLSGFKGETEGRRSWAGLNCTCYGLTTLGKKSITSSFETLSGLPENREEPTQPWLIQGHYKS